MLCPKCNAELMDGATRCTECGAAFEKHIGSFAGSVHFEDEVKPPKSRKSRNRALIFWGIILVLVVGFDIARRLGLLEDIFWWFLYLRRFLSGK